jgi:integration host factor subunit beta
MKVNYNELLKEVSRDTGISVKDVKLVVNSFIDKIKDKLVKGFEINILTFCKFKPAEVSERNAYSFKLGKVTGVPKRLLPKCDFVREFKQQFK